MISAQALWLIVVLAAVALAAGPPVAVERTEGALRYEASMPKPTYPPGEPVGVTLKATNTGGAPVALTFTSGQRYDLMVRRPRGDEVWRWSHDKAFIQVIQTVTLQPRESLSFAVTWDQVDFQGRQVDPGVYEAIAVFHGRIEGGRDVRLTPLAFSIAY